MAVYSTPHRRKVKLRQAERDRKVLALVRAGATLQQISDALGLSGTSHASGVWRDAVRRAGPTEEEKRYARFKHRDRLEALWRTAYKRAMGDEENGVPPDPKWFENARKLAHDICEFEGTSAPKEVRLGGSRGAPPVAISAVEYGDLTELTDDQLAEARRALEQAATAVAAATEAAAGGPGTGEEEEGEIEGE